MAKNPDSIEIQDLVVSSDGEELALRTTGFRKFRDVTLDQHGAYQLIDYLNEAFETRHERRQAYRVNLGAFSGLKATLYSAQGELELTVQSLSLTGLYGELEREIELQEGGRVRVLLEYAGEDLILTGVVRRVKGKGVGLFFPEAIVDEHLSPPPLLEQVIHDTHRRESSFSTI